MIGVVCLWVSSATPSNEINGTILTSTKPLISTPTHTTAIRESLNVVLYDGHVLQTFSDKPDVIVYANIQEFPPPEGVTILNNCTETTCWRSSQFLSLRNPGTFLEASGPVTAEVGVQFWGDTNDGLCRVLVDGQEVWKGNTYGTDGNWPGGAFVKYLYISGLSLEAHTIRVEFVGPGDVTIRYFGFGPAAP